MTTQGFLSEFNDFATACNHHTLHGIVQTAQPRSVLPLRFLMLMLAVGVTTRRVQWGLYFFGPWSHVIGSAWIPDCANGTSVTVPE